MHYKTIILELIEQRPQLHQQLTSGKNLLAAIDQYATELKANHEEWKSLLLRAAPSSDPARIASETLELAVEQMQERLPSESPKDEAEPLSLDAAMTFLKRHTPPA